MATIHLADIRVTRNRRRADPEKVAELARSIGEIGLLNPVTLTTDLTLIAGLHRLEAHRLLGLVDIEATILELDALRAELAQIDENLIRNEGTVLERAQAVQRRKELYEAMYPETRHGGAPGKAGGGKVAKEGNLHSFAEDTAEKTGVSSSTIRRASQIASDIAPDVQEAIADLPIADVQKDLLELARLTADEQRAVAEKIVSGEAKTVKGAKRAMKREAQLAIPDDLPPASDRYQLFVADVRTCEAVAPGSVDVIITDPPYPREYLPLYEDLAKLATRVLKPGGSLLVMVGQSYLPAILEFMTPHINYHWMLAYLTPGGQSPQLWQRNVNTFWKPVLWFVNGEYQGDWIGDVVKSDTNDKRFHAWGQSESGMAALVEKFSKPGDTILDPFVGGGTTGVVALLMNRQFIGFDVEEDAVAQSVARLAKCCAEMGYDR